MHDQSLVLICSIPCIVAIGAHFAGCEANRFDEIQEEIVEEVEGIGTIHVTVPASIPHALVTLFEDQGRDAVCECVTDSELFLCTFETDANAYTVELTDLDDRSIASILSVDLGAGETVSLGWNQENIGLSPQGEYVGINDGVYLLETKLVDNQVMLYGLSIKSRVTGSSFAGTDEQGNILVGTISENLRMVNIAGVIDGELVVDTLTPI